MAKNSPKADITKKMEVHFEPVKTDVEREDFFKALFSNQTSLHIKYKSVRAKEEDKLTVVKMRTLNKNVLVAEHVSGPLLVAPSEITMAFETDQDRFYATGELSEVIKKTEYIFEVEDLFKMFSRPIRLHLPPTTIAAIFNLLEIDDMKWPQKLRVINISSGGFALEVLHESKKIFEEGATLIGQLSVDGSHPIELRAEIKYCQKQKFFDSTVNLHIGCQFVDAPPSLFKRISNIINDSYRRILFKKVK
jgi:hypothetical protein